MGSVLGEIEMPKYVKGKKTNLEIKNTTNTPSHPLIELIGKVDCRFSIVILLTSKCSVNRQTGLAI